MQIVAEVKNMTGICHVTTWSKPGCRRVWASQSRSRMVFKRSLRRFSRPSRCDERRCSRTVWSAAVKRLKRLRTMPQYHVVRMGQGESSPDGRMEGQDPVEVRTPAKRAACRSSARTSLHRTSYNDYLKGNGRRSAEQMYHIPQHRRSSAH